MDCGRFLQTGADTRGARPPGRSCPPKNTFEIHKNHLIIDFFLNLALALIELFQRGPGGLEKFSRFAREFTRTQIFSKGGGHKIFDLMPPPPQLEKLCIRACLKIKAFHKVSFWDLVICRRMLFR